MISTLAASVGVAPVGTSLRPLEPGAVGAPTQASVRAVAGRLALSHPSRGVVNISKWGEFGPYREYPQPPRGGGETLVPAEPVFQHDLRKEAAELVVAKQEVESIRGFFRNLGVRDSEGNDATTVKVDDAIDNAYYSPQTDEVVVGVFPMSQLDERAKDVSFTQAPDVLAHEWTHRIVQHLVPGVGSGGEDAAINESLADTFAMAYDTKNWTIGEGLGMSVRTFDNPNADRLEHRAGHPSSVADVQRLFMRPEYYTPQIEPEPHALSGLPSKAASIIGKQLGRDTMAKIYIKAVRDYMRPGKNITGLALDTMKSAAALYGDKSKEMAAVTQAWDAVGILDVLNAHPHETVSIVPEPNVNDAWIQGWMSANGLTMGPDGKLTQG